MPFLPCFLCGQNLDKRITKKEKPYFVCDPCGVQLFVRGKQGMERLERFLHASEQKAITLEHAAQRVFEVQALLTEIDGTKAQIKKMDDEIGLFCPDEDKVRARNALKTRLAKLVDEFEKYCARTRT
jgi:DNA-directed RNA polymerase subunit RPC12/RpoP